MKNHRPLRVKLFPTKAKQIKIQLAKRLHKLCYTDTGITLSYRRKP